MFRYILNKPCPDNYHKFLYIYNIDEELRNLLCNTRMLASLEHLFEEMISPSMLHEYRYIINIGLYGEDLVFILNTNDPIYKVNKTNVVDLELHNIYPVGNRKFNLINRGYLKFNTPLSV